VGEKTRVALYCRISTKDQDVGLQIEELRTVAAQRGLAITAEFVDEGISGTTARRPAMDALMAAAHRGEFDVVLVWRFDRFGRSVQHLVRALETFRRLGIDFISLREQIDTGTAVGRMVYHLIASIAEFEAALIRERVRAGVDRARRQGKQLGRPRRDDLDLERARRLLGNGQSVASVAKALGVPRGTLRSALARAGEKRALRERVATPASC
jgi:DNA invertase Pin-like site-specific DNA recombinase